MGMLSQVAGLLREEALSGTPKSWRIGSFYLILPHTRLILGRMWWKRGSFPGLIQKDQKSQVASEQGPFEPHHVRLHFAGLGRNKK